MRKQWKAAAKKRVREYYRMFVIICLIAGFLGIEYNSSVDGLRSVISGYNNMKHSEGQFGKVMRLIIEGEDIAAIESAEDYVEMQKNNPEKFMGVVALEKSDGVLAQLANNISSGAIVNKIYTTIHSVVKSKNIAIALMVIVSLLVVMLFSIFVLNVYRIIFVRFFLEARIYDNVPLGRFLYLIRVKKWKNVSFAMLRHTIYLFLWTLTIIGGVVKSYSYLMVPYILAENPSITGKEAITLSRKMMYGHKWEAFVLTLSFLGWILLDILTFGISGILFSNPYMEATFAEYYEYVRRIAKENEIPGIEMLSDKYLFEKAEDTLLRETYADVLELVEAADVPVHKNKGVRGFFENVFGITMFYDDKEMEYEALQNKRTITAEVREVLNKNMYPRRLYILEDNQRIKKPSTIHYDRHYSVVSLIFIFFTMCFVGWIWEVILHLFFDGKFINRGMLHGPWLPIYGAGVVLILTFLYKFRNRPVLEFVAAIVLCGVVEYTTASVVEYLFDGLKWWDYSGYYLNIDAKVCAEGLLVFGLGGLASVYMIAPFLDNIFRRIPKKIGIILCAVLLSVFAGDIIYSAFNPNTGKGITDQSSAIEVQSDIDMKEWEALYKLHM